MSTWEYYRRTEQPDGWGRRALVNPGGSWARRLALGLCGLGLALATGVLGANQSPWVVLLTPLNEATHLAPADLTLEADVWDEDGNLEKVEFYEGSTRLAEVGAMPATYLYSFVWTNVATGNYTLTAKAIDTEGAVTVSSPVRVVVNNDHSRRVIYSTGFEAAEGYDAQFELAGQNGWTYSGVGYNGFVSDWFPGQGDAAYIGYGSPTNTDSLFLWRPVNYAPEPELPLVKFSVLMQINDSSNEAYDYFRWQLYNSEGTRLFTLDFDNGDLHVYYRLEGDAAQYVDTGRTFTATNDLSLVVTLDVPANRWEAILDGTTLVSPQPITSTGARIDIGDFGAVWVPFDPEKPGDNFMAFDNYRIEAEARGGSGPTLSFPQPPTNGRLTLRSQGAPGRACTLFRSDNLRDWLEGPTRTADSQGVVEFVEPVVGARHFYRVRQD